MATKKVFGFLNTLHDSFSGDRISKKELVKNKKFVYSELFSIFVLLFINKQQL